MGILEGDGLWGQFVGADTLSADLTYNFPRTDMTVPTDAIQSQQPVDASTSSNAGGGWTGFMQNLAGTLTGYAIAKDIATTNASLQSQQLQRSVAAQSTVQRANSGSLLTLLLIGGGAYLLLKKV